MHRRALLAALGTLSAGCLGGGSSDPTTATETTASETTTAGTPTPETATAGTTSPRTEAPQTADTETPDPDAEFELTDFGVSTRTDRPASRYVLEPDAFYSSDAVEREETRTGEQQVVMAVSDVADPAVREAVETAIRDGEWRSDDIPEGLADLAERVDFFTGVGSDGTYTHVGLALYRFDPDAPPAVEFDASVADPYVAPGDPGELTLALTNASSESRTVFSGTVPPFGVVTAERTTGEGRFLLWRPYEEEGCVFFDEDGWGKCSIGVATELAPGQTVSRTYEVLPSATGHHPAFTVPPGPGRYRVADSVSHYAQSGAPESELSFEVEFALESR